MAVALLDTNVLFASASARDDYHEPARAIVRGVDHGELPDALVTNYVVAETLNLTAEKLGPDIANGLLDRLREATHFDIVHATQSDFATAQLTFRRYPELSFVDATITAYAEREGVEALYSFDDDFDAIDSLTRLSTPDNPYS